MSIQELLDKLTRLTSHITELKLASRWIDESQRSGCSARLRHLEQDKEDTLKLLHTAVGKLYHKDPNWLP